MSARWNIQLGGSYSLANTNGHGIKQGAVQQKQKAPMSTGVGQHAVKQKKRKKK